MQKLGLNELRTKFLEFFEEKQHLILPSFSLVPQNDKSLLLVNAGMAPLKPYFTGQETPPNKKVATCQKCIRTPDIENVGRTSRHATFFEMLGNFSFGDYFKKEAIKLAWEFVTERLNLPVDKLWITIYLEDDEAFKIWHEDIGVAKERIVRMGKEDNFWEIGTGPCGPCSEMFFDMGPDRGCGKPDCAIGCDCDRFVEFWNLVFTQFDKDEEGNYHPLAHPNIDTGMGLERMAAIMQDVDSIFEIDAMKSIMDEVSKISGISYGEDAEKDVSLRVIADHIRATTFMISDGVLPSNEGRGYVLRRILRRASRHGKLLGIDKIFLKDIADIVIEEFHNAYPELLERRDYILKTIQIEEERFNDTIDQGLNILSGYIDQLKTEKRNILGGDIAFKLYDTYGFPLDLTKEILEEHNLKVDEQSFDVHMKAQRERARMSREDTNFMGNDEGIAQVIDANIDTKFVGYQTLETEGEILYIIKDGQSLERASEGDKVLIVLNRTPFYAEGGGQVGDRGIIIGKQNSKVQITDTRLTPNSKIVHEGKIIEGEIIVGERVEAKVDKEHRVATARNHTCTHLLHEALKQVLGEHVEQAGSLVSAERLRFDFSHFTNLESDELQAIEDLINREIYKASRVEIIETTMDNAKKIGAVALFGEKYSEDVRVVKIDGFSKELCGGTHVSNTSEIGLFKIVSESGVAAGIRRIEAYTGLNVYRYLNHIEKIMHSSSHRLKSAVEDMPTRIDALLDELRAANREIETLRREIAIGAIDDIIKKKDIIDKIPYIATSVEEQDMDSLRNMADMLRDKLGTGVIILASGYNDRVNLIAAATKDVVEKGIHCGNLIREVAKEVGGGGGGRPDMAQAGGRDVDRIDIALEKVANIISAQVSK